MSDIPVDTCATAPPRQPIAEEVTELVLELARRLHAYCEEQVARLDLTAAQALLLRQIVGAVPMGEIAGKLGCDASNLTGIVDRLETRGLVERRVNPADRRVKQLVLTGAGSRLRERAAAISMVAPGVSALSADELRALRELLRRAIGAPTAQRADPSAPGDPS